MWPFFIGFAAFVVIFRQFFEYWPKQASFHYIFRENNTSFVFLIKYGKIIYKILEKNKNVKATYLPYFFGDVTGNTHISFFSLTQKYTKLSRNMSKQTLWIRTMSETNRAVQPLEMAKGLKFEFRK